MERVTKKRALIAVAVLAVAAGGFRKWRKGKEAGPATEAVTRGDLQVRFRESGDVGALVYADVASKVSGRITALKVEEGQAVKAGAALAVIQPGRTGAEQYVPSTVASPLGGVVMRYVPDSQTGSQYAPRWPRVGDYVTGIFDAQSPTYLLTVADLSKLVVRMQISEMDILKLSPGMPVKVTVDALPGKTFEGRVHAIAPQAEKNSAGLKVFKVEVLLTAADPKLRPGMTARVDALLEERKGVLKIPVAAVFEEGPKSVVFVEGAEPKRVEVELGLRGEMEAEAVKADGLAEGAKLLTERPAPGGKRKWWSFKPKS